MGLARPSALPSSGTLASEDAEVPLVGSTRSGSPDVHEKATRDATVNVSDRESRDTRRFTADPP